MGAAGQQVTKRASLFQRLGTVLGVVAVCCVVLVLAATVYAFTSFALWTEEVGPWESVTVETTDGSFAFRRRHSHPFQAEYDRVIDFSNGNSVELRPNTGGKPFLNVYEIEQEDRRYVLLLDRFAAYRLDLHGEVVTSERWDREFEHPPSEVPQHFVGRIEGYAGELRFVPASAEPEFAIPDSPDPWGRELPSAPGDATLAANSGG